MLGGSGITVARLLVILTRFPINSGGLFRKPMQLSQELTQM